MEVQVEVDAPQLLAAMIAHYQSVISVCVPAFTSIESFSQKTSSGPVGN